ncbi:MAG: hypothetical protein JO280_19870 [Mycobacteriaceae bacterium]|nr:hypothetical protein [Mycobacteriaceae bacterium]
MSETPPFNLFGNGNRVAVGNIKAPTMLSVAFNAFGNNNGVFAQGPLAIAGAVGINDHNLMVNNAVVQDGPGVNIKTPLNP